MKRFVVTHNEIATVKAEDKHQAEQKAIEGDIESGWSTDDYEVDRKE